MTRIAVAVAVASGCAADVEEGLVVCVVADTCATPPCPDRLEVRVAVGESAAGPFCDPRVDQPITVAPRFPYCVAIAPGERFDAVAVLRAELHVGTDRLARREATYAFEAGRQGMHELALAPCPDACTGDEQCVDGACVPVEWPDLFDDSPQPIEPGLACVVSR